MIVFHTHYVLQVPLVDNVQHSILSPSQTVCIVVLHEIDMLY